LIGGSMIGSALSGSLAKRIPPRAKGHGLHLLLAGCASNVLYNAFTDAPVVPWAVLPITCYTLGISLLMPILTLQVMGMFQMRGLASSLQGFTQMSVFATMAGAVVPHLFHSGLALALGQAITVSLGALIWWWATRTPVPQADRSRVA
jgi:DHA1 family bicyclomycin/chloramphenicol resistance-like MFS transporter